MENEPRGKNPVAMRGGGRGDFNEEDGEPDHKKVTQGKGPRYIRGKEGRVGSG